MKLPQEVEDIIMDYHYGLEHFGRLQKCMIELYYHGFLHKRPRFLVSVMWIIGLI